MPKSLSFPGDSGVNGRYQEQVGEWGRRPYPTTGLTDVVPPNPTAVDPIGNYVYDAALGFWVPMPGSASGIVEKFSELIANHLAAILGDTHSLNATADSSLAGLSNLLELVNTRYGGNQAPYLWESMLNAVNALGFRKTLPTDAGAYTAVAAGATTISYTGVVLAGTGVPAGITCGVVWNLTDRTLHSIVSVTDPAGAVPGVITVATPFATAGAVLLVPYSSLPHAYNSAADAIQSIAVVGDPPRINGPAQFISINGVAVVNNTYQYIIPCALYGRPQVQIRWAVNGNTLFQFRSYGKVDNTIAWPAAGSMVAGQCIDSLWQYATGSLAFNSPPTGGAATNVINARLQDPHGFDSIAIEMIISNQSGTSTVTAFYRLTGGTA